MKQSLEYLLQARRVKQLLDGVYKDGVQKSSMINVWREHLLPQVGCTYRAALRYLLVDTSGVEREIALAQARAIVGHRTRYTARLERQLRAKGEIYPEVFGILDGGAACDELLRDDVGGDTPAGIIETAALSGESERSDRPRIYVPAGLDR